MENYPLAIPFQDCTISQIAELDNHSALEWGHLLELVFKRRGNWRNVFYELVMRTKVIEAHLCKLFGTWKTQYHKELQGLFVHSLPKGKCRLENPYEYSLSSCCILWKSKRNIADHFFLSCTSSLKLWWYFWCWLIPTLETQHSPSYPSFGSNLQR